MKRAESVGMDGRPMRWKDDAEEISRFIHSLAAEPWLGEKRRRWPYQLFHLSDVRNAVNIISTGRLLSRQNASDCGVLVINSASRPHINRTDPRVHDCVRLYFRPRNKTFKINEGFLPRDRVKFDSAHCPMPVAFVFDSETVLAMEGTRFSDGNLARSRKYLGSDVGFLRELPFEHIYRDPGFDHSDTLDRFDGEVRDNLDDYRQAEVVVPGSLSLNDTLLYVCVRSEAEKETLLTLLDAKCAGQSRDFQHEIVVDHAGNHFFHRSVYVQSVSRQRQAIHVTFNRHAKHKGPFHAGFDVLNVESGDLADQRHDPRFTADPDYFHGLPDYLLHHDSKLVYRVRLDERVAFLGVI